MLIHAIKMIVTVTISMQHHCHFERNMNFWHILLTWTGKRSSWWCYSGAFWQRCFRRGQKRCPAYIFSPTVHCLWKSAKDFTSNNLGVDSTLSYRKTQNFDKIFISEWRWLMLAMDWQGLRPVERCAYIFSLLLLLLTAHNNMQTFIIVTTV